MTELFRYDKDEFEQDIISFLKNTDTTFIRQLVDGEMGNCCQTFKNAVFRRIISFRVGKNWWLKDDEICRRSKITSELVAIWKLVIAHKRIIYEYEEQTVEEYSHERLADVEKDFADGKFNEQAYIDKCNWIMHLKNVDENLLGCCDCSPIGSINSQILYIVCMPCLWDKNATCVKFN